MCVFVRVFFFFFFQILVKIFLYLSLLHVFFHFNSLFCFSFNFLATMDRAVWETALNGYASFSRSETSRALLTREPLLVNLNAIDKQNRTVG